VRVLLEGDPAVTLPVRGRYWLDTSSLNRATPVQWEWVNPRPEAEIKRVEVRHANSMGATLILMAVSGRTLAPVSEPPVKP
jgi:hypothetical protein